MRDRGLDAWFISQKAQVMSEASRAAAASIVLLERLESDDLRQIDRAIDQLKAVLGPAWDKLPHLRGALRGARQKLASAEADIRDRFKSFDGFKRSIASSAAAAVSRDLAAVMAAAAALVAGFRALPKILKGIRAELPAESAGSKPKRVPLAAAIGAIADQASRDEVLSTPLRELEIADEPIDLDAAKQAMAKAFTPTGLMAVVRQAFRGSALPLVDASTVAEELTGLSMHELTAIAERSRALKPPVQRDDLAQAAKGAATAPAPKRKPRKGLEDRVRELDDAMKRRLLRYLKLYPPKEPG